MKVKSQGKAMPKDLFKTFLSYARKDSQFVLRLVEDLRNAGVDVWMDQRDLVPGQLWDTEIEKALHRCSHHVTVLSPDAVKSANVKDEMSYALQKRKTLIPLLYRSCAIPFRLRRVHHIDFRTEYAVGLRELLKALAITPDSAATGVPQQAVGSAATAQQSILAPSPANTPARKIKSPRRKPPLGEVRVLAREPLRPRESALAEPKISAQHQPNRLYAHWLDGEWLKTAYPITVEGRHLTVQAVAEGALKFHALFGTRIALSDVQLTDSPVILGLFANPEFREYLKHDSGFLALVALPRNGISNERLARATRGLERTFQNGWNTSLPGITEDIIRQFAEPILSVDKLDLARAFKDRSKGPAHVIESFPQHKEFLEGMLHGIAHFSKQTGGPSENPKSGPPRAYTNFIEDALKDGGLAPNDYGVLEQVWQSIKIWVPDDSKRYARSALLNALTAKEPNRNRWPPEWHRIWNTVVHAWNGNVCDTVGALGASIVPLPGAVIPYRGKISGVTGPFIQSAGLLRANIAKRYPTFSFDPSELTWSSVLKAVQRVRASRTRFQTELRKGNPADTMEASNKLVRELGDTIAPHPHLVVPHWLWAPISVIALLAHIPVLHGLEAADGMQALVRSGYRARVLNTLHGFKNDLIKGFTNTDNE